MFGLTTEGFNIKRLADIKLEIEAAFKDTFGQDVNLTPNSPFGQMIGIFSEREALIWQVLQDNYNSAYPSTAQGLSLDFLASLSDLLRREATSSRATLVLSGTPGTVVPIGSQVSVAGNTDIQFQTIASATIAAGQNAQQRLDFSTVPDAGAYSLSHDGNETTTLAFNSSASAVQAALNGLPTLSAVVVTGDTSTGFVVDFSGADGLKSQPLIAVASTSLVTGATPLVLDSSTTIEGVPNQVEVDALALSTGPINAPAGTLATIDTPVSGWDAVTNPEDVILGQDRETDAEFKIRRNATLAAAGAGTLGSIRARLLTLSGVLQVIGFENNTLLTDLDGREAKSFEMIVRGGDIDEICAEIWDAKPAGIKTEGNVTCNFLDDEGFPQTVNFSRPVGVDIYIELDLSVNSEYPANGANLVQEALVAYGNGLQIGDDVITYPKVVAALCDVPGITDVVIRIGKTSGPTLDDNVIIADNELAEIDSSRIQVTIL